MFVLSATCPSRVICCVLGSACFVPPHRCLYPPPVSRRYPEAACRDVPSISGRGGEARNGGVGWLGRGRTRAGPTFCARPGAGAASHGRTVGCASSQAASHPCVRGAPFIVILQHHWVPCFSPGPFLVLEQHKPWRTGACGACACPNADTSWAAHRGPLPATSLH